MRKFMLGLTVAALLGFSATAASAAVVAQDDFQRTVTSGWGSAPVGGAWTRSAELRPRTAWPPGAAR